MKEFGIEEQKLIIDKYTENHRRRFLWHRIISVLSAIVVFCATYSLLLPAFTMEDPTLGVKLSNQYTYENENLSAVFTVTGRAIFKEENIEIENPQASLVDLNVAVLDKDDKVYEAYEEYAADSIGEEELANIMAFELKFTYLGHELDMKKCDIVAEINAKEVFFTDDFGTEYDGSVYVADPTHPMADNKTESSEPAMAFTAIQGTSLNVYDAPTVYTTDVEEVSTLTVDVKGNTLALLTSATANPTFTVQYYALITRVDTEPESTTGLTPLEVIDTRNGIGTPTKNQTFESLTNKTNIYLQTVTGISQKTHSVVTKQKLTKLYKEVEYSFAEAPGYEYVDRLSENGNYKIERVRKLKDGKLPDSTTLADWEQYYASNNPSFTNNEALANSKNKIYIEEGTVIRMVYTDSGVNQIFDDEVTMFDYDISNGQYSTTGSVLKETSTQSNTSTAFIKTNAQGINAFTSATGTPTFAFGSVNTGTGFGDDLWNNIKINGANAFGLVKGINLDNDDFIPVFDSGVNAPDMFSKVNEHDPAGNTVELFPHATYFVANYDATNNINTETVDKTSTVWKDLTGRQTDITVENNENNHFTNDSYVTNGGVFYLPDGVRDKISGVSNWTLEIEFGDIRNTKNPFVLFSDESGTNLLKLCIDNLNNLCLYKGGSKLISVSNGIDLVTYSTISIVHTTQQSGKLYLYCDGVKIGEKTGFTDTVNLGDNRLCFGSVEGTQHTTEYKSIRLYSGGFLGPSRVKQNAQHNKTRSINAANDSTTGGKTVIGGRTIEFKRNCDTYTLTAIRNGSSDLENLEYFTEYTTPVEAYASKVWTNDFWPMDYAGTYGTNGHDIKFGTLNYQATRRFYGIDTIAHLNNPWGTPYTEPPTGEALKGWRKNVMPISDDNKDHNSYFGMKYKVDFSIEEDYSGPLEYFFYGDDDLWVFLDDQLVCDIGGIHSSVGQLVDLWDYLPDEGYEGDHTLYMFYLERGASGSSCYMQFTLPSASINTPQQTTTSLSLEKTLKNSDTTADFEFEVELYDTNGALLTNNYSYAIYNADGLETGEIGTIEAGKGTVQLKGGEKILINFLPVGTKYKITENDEIFFTTYSVNGDTAVEGKSVEGALNVATSVVFTNTAGDKLPSTGVLGGGMSVVIYYIPLGIATVYMCAMPIINRPKKTKK